MHSKTQEKSWMLLPESSHEIQMERSELDRNNRINRLTKEY